ncbi:thioredoxin reductase [Haloterrigena salina JCM 13891]|uniref:Thioredoxin reductase n=1 Tax=Haloterrigena salina JCM 13891 TaxID=1227488 RepID=M0BZ83_9EURY|nr:hypothetical protein [Haloterrigena salina]ELZ14974.1 thioredoxin reductase [Haloterrigena salina JCM 13891]
MATAPNDRDANEIRHRAESDVAERDDSNINDETATRRDERGQRRLAQALERIRERAAKLERSE